MGLKLTQGTEGNCCGCHIYLPASPKILPAIFLIFTTLLSCTSAIFITDIALPLLTIIQNRNSGSGVGSGEWTAP